MASEPLFPRTTGWDHEWFMTGGGAAGRIGGNGGGFPCNLWGNRWYERLFAYAGFIGFCWGRGEGAGAEFGGGEGDEGFGGGWGVG